MTKMRRSYRRGSAEASVIEGASLLTVEPLPPMGEGHGESDYAISHG